MMKVSTNNTISNDLKRMFTVSGIGILGLMGFMFFSPLSYQFTEEGVGRGNSWEMDIMEHIDAKNYTQVLNMVDSLISSKQEDLPRFAYLDRFLPDEKRIDATNARTDIYDLQWKRIMILKEMGNRSILVDALKDYCSIIGYNQDKAKTLLHSIENR